MIYIFECFQATVPKKIIPRKNSAGAESNLRNDPHACRGHSRLKAPAFYEYFIVKTVFLPVTRDNIIFF